MLTRAEGIHRDPATVQDGPPSTAQQLLNWRAHLRVHPAAELFPLLSETELRELAEDIKKHGLHELPVVYRDPELGVCVLDGRNRLDALELIGWPAGVEASRIIRPSEPFDPVAYVLSKNLHRRHLTADQRRDLIAKVLKAKPEASNRQIAKQVKADDKTVAKVRTELEATAEIPQLEKTKGKDGKARPTKAKKKSVPISAPIEAVNGAEPEAKPVSASAEISLEQRRAEHAALDLSHEEKAETKYAEWLKASDEAHKASARALDEFTTVCRTWLPKVTERHHQYKAHHLVTKMTESGAPVVPSLGFAIEHKWLEAERAFEALTAHPVAQVAQVASAIPPGKAARVTEIANYFTALAAKLTAHSAGNGEASIAGSDYSIPDDLSIPHGLKRGDAS